MKKLHSRLQSILITNSIVFDKIYDSVLFSKSFEIKPACRELMFHFILYSRTAEKHNGERDEQHGIPGSIDYANV